MKYHIELVDKIEIKIGDTILCDDGEIKTVCRGNIAVDGFMGLSIFGNSYRLGYQKVQKVIIHDWKYKEVTPCF